MTRSGPGDNLGSKGWTVPTHKQGPRSPSRMVGGEEVGKCGDTEKEGLGPMTPTPATSIEGIEGMKRTEFQSVSSSGKTHFSS